MVRVTFTHPAVHCQVYVVSIQWKQERLSVTICTIKLPTFMYTAYITYTPATKINLLSRNIIIWDFPKWKLWLNCLNQPAKDRNQNCLLSEKSHRTAILKSGIITLSPPIPSRLYTLPDWSNPTFLIFDIPAIWHSRLSARVPECQKLKMVD